jgi:hypothetical protein
MFLKEEETTLKLNKLLLYNEKKLNFNMGKNTTTFSIDGNNINNTKKEIVDIQSSNPLINNKNHFLSNDFSLFNKEYEFFKPSEKLSFMMGNLNLFGSNPLEE